MTGSQTTDIDMSIMLFSGYTIWLRNLRDTCAVKKPEHEQIPAKKDHLHEVTRFSSQQLQVLNRIRNYAFFSVANVKTGKQDAN